MATISLSLIIDDNDDDDDDDDDDYDDGGDGDDILRTSQPLKKSQTF